MSTDNLKNFGFAHKSGILMAVSSLPSPYGIGCFGAPCYRWIDFLVECGTKCWQVLPLNPTAYADSPYQSPCSNAGNPYFIDLQALYEQKLLTKKEIDEARCNTKQVDYGMLFTTRYALFAKAYARFSPDKQYEAFCTDNKYWLDDYALFMALKVANNYASWIDWGVYSNYQNAIKVRAQLSNEIGYWKFLQYCFYTQWQKVRLYAKEKGIVIIGDMPIYVAYDSVEVWSKPDNYLLNSKLKPTLVAGCPPDGFSADGQLWGNPIYNWAKMKADGFDWWVQRVKHCMKLYDIVRIDHFRGFAGYFTVKYGQSTAREGKWKKGVGKQLFAQINALVPYAKIIAEDLGFITPDVKQLLEFCAYPGMKLLQCAFYDDDSTDLPQNYTTNNCIVYTGSHDSECTYSWCKNLSGAPLKRFTKLCPRAKGVCATDALIDMAFGSIANLAVIPLQDWLKLTNEQGRMNCPSVAEGNWRWRASNRYASRQLIARIRAVTQKHGRLA